MGVIDIGAAAIDRGYGAYTAETEIAKENPANDDGKITSVELWAISGDDLTDCEVATFIDEGSNVFSTRDIETLGTVTAGSKQTFSGLDMAVITGIISGYITMLDTLKWILVAMVYGISWVIIFLAPVRHSPS